MRNSTFLIVFLLFLPALLPAQEKPQETDITGLWKGSLYNDSTHQYYKYEIGISEEKNKMFGYSYTMYNDSDRNYFVVKKVKVKRDDGKIIIEDVDIVTKNYPEKAPKGVKRLHVLELYVQDSILRLEGPFSTNRTKTYAPVTGMVKLQRKNDFRKQSDLIPHLQELKMDNELSFVAKDNELRQAEEEKSLSKVSDVAQAAVPEIKATTKEPVAKTSEPKKIVVEPTRLPPAKSKIVQSNEAAADVLLRKNIVQETMYFKTDSLVLTLYDNGEVDGDTVSVLMNGVIIMPKQGLSTTAIRKTIHIPAETDTIELIMYAESLGTIPPNTGLLMVKDGKDTYEVRFSGDLQKNASVILKRRKN
ncbi:MAG: hypothetical protein JST81_04950 [Bacteroidetes bacterium]|nr:hypothetical protein [Bacteroidota bacterium]